MENTIKNILIIEDNPADARLVQEMLKESRHIEFVTTKAEYLSEGLTMIEENQYDAVLLDLSLPDSQGLDTFNQVINKAPDLPVIILTGLRDEELTLSAVKLGAQDFIFKSDIEPKLLARSISYAIERKQLMIELKEATEKVKTLRGFIPICSSCKKIRDDKGFWNMLEEYITEHSGAEFSHGICPDCAEKIYGKFLRDEKE